jgi:hypothetical protein
MTGTFRPHRRHPPRAAENEVSSNNNNDADLTFAEENQSEWMGCNSSWIDLLFRYSLLDRLSIGLFGGSCQGFFGHDRGNAKKPGVDDDWVLWKKCL